MPSSSGPCPYSAAGPLAVDLKKRTFRVSCILLGVESLRLRSDEPQRSCNEYISFRLEIRLSFLPLRGKHALVSVKWNFDGRTSPAKHSIGRYSRPDMLFLWSPLFVEKTIVQNDLLQDLRRQLGPVEGIPSDHLERDSFAFRMPFRLLRGQRRCESSLDAQLPWQDTNTVLSFDVFDLCWWIDYFHTPWAVFYGTKNSPDRKCKVKEQN